jgi:hypothetical protein
MPPFDLSQNPFTLLSLIGAPAVLTNAASVLALSTSNRFLRASERMRSLSLRMEKPIESRALRDVLLAQVNRTERQAVLLLHGLRAAYVALGSFASASLISILGGLFAHTPWHGAFRALAILGLAVGFVGAGGIVVASIRLMAATRLSVLNMSEEAALIRDREQVRVLAP